MSRIQLEASTPSGCGSTFSRGHYQECNLPFSRSYLTADTVCEPLVASKNSTVIGPVGSMLMTVGCVEFFHVAVQFHGPAVMVPLQTPGILTGKLLNPSLPCAEVDESNVPLA